MAIGKICCGGNIRTKCFVVGYMNLVACVVDIGFHLLTAGMVSNWFQCDINVNSLQSIDWPWLKPLLFIINIGTHGFYPIPLVLDGHYNHLEYVQYTGVLQPHGTRCYPGMLHIYLIDILNLLINVIWLKFVLTYISALHKKDPEPMRLFFSLSAVKVLLQVLYFSYQPGFQYNFSMQSYWILRLLDIAIATYFLFVIRQYVNILQHEKQVLEREQINDVVSGELPPSYIECLIASQKPTEVVAENKDINITVVSNNDEPAIIKPETS